MLPAPMLKTQLARPQEVNVQIARLPMLRKLEVMVFEVRDVRARHDEQQYSRCDAGANEVGG